MNSGDILNSKQETIALLRMLHVQRKTTSSSCRVTPRSVRTPCDTDSRHQEGSRLKTQYFSRIAAIVKACMIPHMTKDGHDALSSQGLTMNERVVKQYRGLRLLTPQDDQRVLAEVHDLSSFLPCPR